MPKKTKNNEVTCTYWSVNVQSYNVSIPEGKFIVMDYDRDDREVFWETGVFPVADHTSEYKAAAEAVDKYLAES